MAYTEEVNVCELWLRRDPVRWVSGAIAGLVAGALSLIVAGLLASAGGLEFLFPVKVASLILVGAAATEFGSNIPAIAAGFVLYEIVAMFLGVVYAHFTATNFKSVLFGIGLVWGIFSWIFIWNLFLQSFLVIRSTHISSGPMFLICLVFGLSLSTVGIFDRALRGIAG